MRLKLTLFLFFLLVCSKSTAQGEQWGIIGSQLTYTQNSITSHDFSFTTYFSFGSPPDTCPSFTSNISFSNDTMYVNGYYNVCGAWPLQGCTRNNVVNYNSSIPDNILYVVMSTNAITNCETGTPVIVENIYTSTYDPHLGTEVFFNNGISIYPNPASTVLTLATKNNMAIDTVIVTDLLGKKVLVQYSNTNTITIESLQKGMYVIEAYSGKHKMICKFVKK